MTGDSNVEMGSSGQAASLEQRLRNGDMQALAALFTQASLGLRVAVKALPRPVVVNKKRRKRFQPKAHIRGRAQFSGGRRQPSTIGGTISRRAMSLTKAMDWRMAFAQ